MNPLESIVEEIKRHKSTAIANQAGLHVNTVRRIRNGIVTNPSVDTLIQIHNAIAELERAK